jgi:hypothetical protein
MDDEVSGDNEEPNKLEGGGAGSPPDDALDIRYNEQRKRRMELMKTSVSYDGSSQNSSIHTTNFSRKYMLELCAFLTCDLRK